MSTKKSQRALNGDGRAAKTAAKRWAYRQTLTQGAYSGPVRLLGLIVASGVPLACYAFADAQLGGWWPLTVGISTPVLVLAIKWLTERSATKRAHLEHPHPLRVSSTNSQL